MENLKNLFNNFVELEAAANAADDAWAEDPENVELEADFDRCYEAEHEALEALINEIVTFTKGEINKKTARTMVMAKRQELELLLLAI